jgi:hypothetical protein
MFGVYKRTFSGIVTSAIIVSPIITATVSSVVVAIAIATVPTTVVVIAVAISAAGLAWVVF